VDLTPEAVRALAPDGGALRAAQPLASAGRWSGVGRSERALWGACQGSGKDPYQVSVDLAGSSPAARCTCPSRKFPCKHALGLMLLAATTPAAVPAASPPSAVVDWLQGRDARARAAPGRLAQEGRDGEDGLGGAAAQVVDEKARARRIATRERRVDDGLQELRIWLRDLARRGLAEVVSEGFKPFDSMAARLVDAQAPGIARALRGVGSRVAASGQGHGAQRLGAQRLGAQPELGPDWADDLLDVLGRQYLLLETYGRRDSLPEATRAEARSLVGWTIREADLPDTDAVADEWLVLGRRHLADERLRATRTYLRGLGSGRDAVILEWEPSSSPALNDPRVGARVRATLAFYPGAAPLRAVVRGPLETLEDPGPPEQILADAPRTWREAVAVYGSKLAASPWLDRWPVVVSNVVPAAAGDDVVYRDGGGEYVASLLAEPAVESLRAFSGGYPVSLFGEWNGSLFTILAAADATAWVALDGTTEDAEMVQMGRVPESDDPVWNELRRYATLGTSRASPGPELEPLVARMADRSAEDQLLSLAASLAIRRRARPRLASAEGAEVIEPAPAETAKRASPGAVHVLGDWLGEPVMVHDWLDHAAAAGVSVPTELLSRVADVRGVTDRSDADARLGPRWRWLHGLTAGEVDTTDEVGSAPSNEAFVAALVDRLERGGSVGGRIDEVLKRFRRHDAPAARAWLDAAWSGLPAPAKDGALAALEDDLDPGDASLIDRLHEEEKSKARRERLATLACRLPGSAVRARIEARARELVGVRGLINRTIEIRPPRPEVFEAMERDGLTLPSNIGSLATGIGSGAITTAGVTIAAIQAQSAVAWHVMRVAPGRWTEWLRLKPPDMVEAFAADKRSGYHFVRALRAATVGHRDEAYAEALLVSVSAHGSGWVGEGLWPLIRPERRESLMARLLFDASKAESWHQLPSLGEALAAAPRPWSPALVGLVHQELARCLSRMSRGEAYLATGRLKAIVTAAPPALLGDLEEQLAGSIGGLDDPSIIDEVLQLLAARRSLDAAFAT
jgi:hypothetical protein